MPAAHRPVRRYGKLKGNLRRFERVLRDDWMPITTPQTAFRAFLYGGAATLLVFDIFFLLKAVFTDNFVPIIPIIAGVLTAAGLLFIVYAEQQAREQDKRDHRRISRVATQLEAPLNKLQGDLTHLLARAGRLPAEERLRLKHMDTAARVLLDNVRDVFLMLQAQEKSVATEIRRYDLCALVGEIIKRAEPQAAARNVTLLYQAHCPNAAVLVEARLLKIAIAHLIENAVVYTRPPGMVNVAVTRGADHARVIVQDHGVGVAPGEEDVIFQPFARGREASQYDPDGIGVGLTLSRLLVGEFGGTLTWQRRSPSGSQFVIALPLARH